MEKKQIYIKCGTEYKEMTKELLEICDLAAVIKKHWGETCGKLCRLYRDGICIFRKEESEECRSE